MAFNTNRDLYQEVTNRIVTALEVGTVPWLRPWKDSVSTGGFMEPHNAVTGRAYNGINVLILGTTHYASQGWLTFKQAKELGGNVRKGEHGTGIVFWKFERREDPQNPGKLKTIPFARMYTVFNVEQCENLDSKRVKLPTPPVPGQFDCNRVAAEKGIRVNHGGNRAFYSPAYDSVQMPSADSFKSPEHYQGTLAHELTHSTGHPSRCNREFGKRFGDMAYAFEELVAEIGSAFFCARTGIPMEGLQHADYVANWLSVLKGDKRAIFTAASKAKEACEFLLGKPESLTQGESSEEGTEQGELGLAA